MFLLLLIHLTCINSNSNSITSIGRRFQRIINFVPFDHSVADIGGDHGQITALLTEHLNKDCSITYIDKSQIAYEKARSYLTSHCLNNRIQMYNGDGLAPLLDSRLTCDTLILAGMGSSTVGNIIRSSTSSTSDYSDISSGTLQALIDIKVKQLVMQPWPINILPMLTLLQLLLSHGWSIDKQGIDEVGEYMYITTSLLSPTPSHTHIQPSTGHVSPPITSISYTGANMITPKKSLDYSSVFRSWPLYQRHSQPPLTTATTTSEEEEEGANISVKNDTRTDENIVEECILWRKYLLKQSKTLIRKSNYIREKGHNSEGSEEYEVCELTRLVQDQLTLYSDSTKCYSKLN